MENNLKQGKQRELLDHLRWYRKKSEADEFQKRLQKARETSPDGMLFELFEKAVVKGIDAYAQFVVNATYSLWNIVRTTARPSVRRSYSYNLELLIEKALVGLAVRILKLALWLISRRR